MRQLFLLASLGAMTLLGAVSSLTQDEVNATKSTASAQADAAENVWLLENSLNMGSGFPVFCQPQEKEGIYRILFLTAKHVVDKGMENEWSARRHDGLKLIGGRVLCVHPTKDIALVSFTTMKKLQALKMATTAPRIGDKVWASGWPMGRHLCITEGIIGGKRHASAPIMFGNSGGPVLDSEGRVVGVAASVGMYRGPIYHMMYFVPAQDFVRWMNESRTKNLPTLTTSKVEQKSATYL